MRMSTLPPFLHMREWGWSPDDEDGDDDDGRDGDDDDDGDGGDGDEIAHLPTLPPYEIVRVKSSAGDAADKRQPRLQADVDVWSTVYAGNRGCGGDCDGDDDDDVREWG